MPHWEKEDGVMSMQDLENLPTRLEDVSTHPTLKLSLMTPDKLLTLPRKSLAEGPVKHRFEHWYVVRVGDDKEGACILFGTPPGERGTWNTSALVAYDGTRVCTRSGSIYELVGEPSNEPDIPYIIGHLNGLGLQRILGLPPIFL